MVIGKTTITGVTRRVIDPRGPAQIAAQQRAQAQAKESALAESKRITESYKAGSISEGAWKTRMGQLAVQTGDPKILSAIAGAGAPVGYIEDKPVILQSQLSELPAHLQQEIFAGRGDYVVIPDLPREELRSWAAESGYRPDKIVRLQERMQREAVEERRIVYRERKVVKKEKPKPLLRSEFIPKPLSFEVPGMRRDIHVTPTGEFVLFRKEPKSIIGLEKVYEKPEPELFEFLVPKRTERELAYGEDIVGVRPLVEFPMGVAYGILTLPAAIVKMPETIAAFATDPIKSLSVMYERFVKMPGFVAGEVAGQVAATYGITKLIKFGISKVRAPKYEVEYLARVERESIWRAAEYGYEVGKPTLPKGVYAAKYKPPPKVRFGFEVSKELKKPLIVEDISVSFYPGKGVGYVVGKTLYERIKPITFKKIVVGKPPKIPEVIPAIAGIKETAGAVRIISGKGILETVAAKRIISVSVPIKLPKPTSFIVKAARVITGPMKPLGKPVVIKPVSAAAAARAATFAKGFERIVGRGAKVTTKLTQIQITSLMYKPAVLGVQEIVSPAYQLATVAGAAAVGIRIPTAVTAPMLRPPVTVQVLDTRQRVATMQKLGMGTGQVQRTMQQLGVRKAVAPRERMAVRERMALATRAIQLPRYAVRERVALKVKPTLISRLVSRTAMRQRVAMPGIIMPGISIPRGIPFALLPERRKVVRRKRKAIIPGYKYKAIKHPFPSIQQLIFGRRRKAKRKRF